MNGYEITTALNLIRPGAKWNLRGHEYAGLTWIDQLQAKPTEQEIIDAIALVVVHDLRRAEYPPMGDQLDAIFKGGLDMAEMKAKIDAVKTKYPKP